MVIKGKIQKSKGKIEIQNQKFSIYTFGF